MKKPLWNRLLKPSTLELLKEGRQTKNYGLFETLHGYVYGRWTYLYIAIGTGQHPLAHAWLKLSSWLRISKKKPAPGTERKTFAEGYHGKVVPLEAARQLVTVQEPVRITNLEKIIPYSRARDLILKNPDHIAVIDCPCRSARENPCLPLDVCLIIGEPFASFVTEHHPSRSRRISQDEAVEILQAEEARGHVHHAFFKDAMLQRFYAICNCCHCCCGAMHAHQNGTPMLASSGYLATVNEDQCLGCGECYGVCQFGALSLDGPTAVVDSAACMGCGICLQVCPQAALSLARVPEKGEPLEILALLGQAESQK